MPASLTTVDAIAKEVYEPRIVDQMENEITLTKRIEKTSRGTESNVGGKYVTFPLKVRRNHGIGYRNELEALPAAGQQGWQNVRVPLRYAYGRVQLSGQTIELVNENYQAFASAMTEEMEGLKTDLAKDTNRVLWGNQTGKIATLGVVAAGNTVAVTDGFGYVEIGMVVDIMDASALPATVVTDRTVTAYDKAAETVTLDGAVFTTEAGDYIVRTGNYLKEAHGIQSLVNDSTASLFNLSSTTEPLWQSEVDSSGGAISESRMITMCDRLLSNGGRPTAIFTDQGTRRAYFNLLTTQRRFTDVKSFDGGLRGLTFAYDDDIPVVVDTDAVSAAMYFLREEDFTIYQTKDWHWEQRDGGIWKWVTGYDAVEAYMKKYWEFAIRRRNTQGVMTGITSG